MPHQRTAVAFLLRLLLFAFVAACVRPSTAASMAAPPAGAAQTIPGLGTTSFATSTKSPDAQTAFLRGLLLLHVFEYPAAADSFQAAQKLDPAFAMAYWGEAMTYNHGVWNQLDATSGKAALARFAPTPAARAARIADPRERAYMAAVELLYDGTGTKPERDLRYAKLMEQLSATYPTDQNARLFYALALLSQKEGVRDVPVYLHAAEISRAVFALEPRNPGAAHYWIHGMDDPEHAAGALTAARELSRIAPDAGHAQHMCSHIFIALGMWDDVVQSNLAAIRVVNTQDRAEGFPAYNCGHYQNWLAYALFQQGRQRAAEQAIAACAQTDVETSAWMANHPGRAPFRARDAAALHQRLRNASAEARAMGIIESGNWDAAAAGAPDPSTLSAEMAAWYDFAAGFAAAGRGDLSAARMSLAALRSRADALHTSVDSDAQDLQALSVGVDELSGLIEVKAGHGDAGVAEVRRAANTYRSMAFAFGPPVTIKPPEELLGEILLARSDAAGARLAFAQCLERAPKRSLSLLGLARADQLAGDRAAARSTYATLLSNLHGADAGTPGLAEAHRFLDAKTSARLVH